MVASLECVSFLAVFLLYYILELTSFFLFEITEIRYIYILEYLSYSPSIALQVVIACLYGLIPVKEEYHGCHFKVSANQCEISLHKHISKLDTTLGSYMPNLNFTQETFKDKTPFVRNDVLQSSKILLINNKKCDETGNTLGWFEGSTGSKEYGPIHDKFFKLEDLSKQTTQISANSSSESHKNNIEAEEFCHLETACLKVPLNLTGNNVTKSNVPDDKESKKAKHLYRTKKIGDIISTSRSGHLIEKRSDSCNVAQKPDKVDIVENSDSNDNNINDSLCEMHDINHNPSDGVVSQMGEEGNLSDNVKSGNSDYETPCGIGLLERLIRSHAIWFLPGIQRAGAVHLLQGKEEGNFIVRQSSQPDTMAVSVRLPAGKGPYIEHYLIQAVEGQLSLESSENMFESIPSLIAHYCQCCDELPVQLTLPRTIREAKNRQQLSSLALLGQEFWRYPMANPRPPESRSSSPNSNKSDSLCSIEGVKKVVKYNHEIILDLVPLQNSEPSSLLSTFKGSSPVDGVPPPLVEEGKPKRPNTLDLICTNTEKTGLFGNKIPPQPPPRLTKISPSFASKSFTSSLSKRKNALVAVSSSCTFSQTTLSEEGKIKSEFSDTSSLLSSVHSSTKPTISGLQCANDISSPQSDTTNLKSFDFDGDKNSLKQFREGKRPELLSPASDNTSLVSKSFEKVLKNQSTSSVPNADNSERAFKKYKRDLKSKESAHYQESDLLESSSLYYYKSNVADKQSDYEDIWATESLTTFKPFPSTPDGDNSKVEEKRELKKRPDLLDKLDNTSKMSFSSKKDDKSGLTLMLQGDDRGCGSQSRELEVDVKSSPFYAEPADALVVRRRTRLSLKKSRHSDPFSFNNLGVSMNPYLSGGNVLDRIESRSDVSEEMNGKGKSSLSFDNLNNLKKKEGETRSKVNLKAKCIAKGKPVRPPKVDNPGSERTQHNWTIDSSWEFIGNEETEKEGERRFPSIEQQLDSDERTYKYTVQEIITQRFPQFKISRGFNSSSNKRFVNKENSFLSRQTPFQKSDKHGSRISAYDNLISDRPNFFKEGDDSDRNSEANCDDFIGSPTSHEDRVNSTDMIRPRNQVFSDTLTSNRRAEYGSVIEDNEDAQTIFSEPWDSSRWENLLSSNNGTEPFLDSVSRAENILNEGNVVETAEPRISEKGSHGNNLKEDTPLQPYFPVVGLKSKELSTTGASIRTYALHLASDKSTTFAQNIDNFIECTLESKETNPQIVMRNMRQFMSGMKNYLVKHGEREFEKQVEKERMKLKSTEFLNLDAILEGVMHKLVVRPLREHLYKLFVDEYFKSGAIELLYENLSYARSKTLYDLGLKTKISPPSQDTLEVIRHFIRKLQEADSPLEKLDHLLACVSAIFHSVKSSNQDRKGIALGADDILPLFVWVLVQSDFIAAEIEAEYMWGLLHPSLLSGEGCYYLTTLSSAVHVLKNLKSYDLDQSNGLNLNEWHCGDFKFVLKIIVPDELHGSILTKTLPVKPNMTTKDVCKIIAHKIRITNPQDYGLFRLVDGEETLLNDNECPQEVKCSFLEAGKHCTLAYKRIDAKIGWPQTT